MNETWKNLLCRIFHSYPYSSIRWFPNPKNQESHCLEIHISGMTFEQQQDLLEDLREFRDGCRKCE